MTAPKPPTRPTTIDGYIAAQGEPAAALLTELRSLAREMVPSATEAIKWGSPAYLHPQGTILFVYSAHAQHANFTFTPSTKEAFAEELSEFETGKGSVKLFYGRPVPTELLRRMISHRLEEYELRGVLWM